MYAGAAFPFVSILISPRVVVVVTCDLPCPVKGVVAVAVADAVARHGGIPALILRKVSKEYAKG